MNISQAKAIQAWVRLKTDSYFECMTPIGSTILMSELPGGFLTEWGYQQNEQARRVAADFLREWADSLDSCLPRQDSTPHTEAKTELNEKPKSSQ